MAPAVKILDLNNTSQLYHAPATIIPAGARTVHISGQPGANKAGIVPNDYESQIHLALLSIRKIILASGATVKDIAKLVVYIVNYEPKQRKHRRHIERFLKGHRPAMTLVPVAQLADPTWLVEIEAVVVCPSEPPSVPRPLHLEGQKSTDVVIIGAGLAGLTAAHSILKAGFSCIVLEARDRVGGKTWSQPMADGNGVLELGAAWINDTNQTKMIALARQFGLELIEQNTEGNVAVQDADGTISSFGYGDMPKFDAASVNDIVRIRDMVEADCQALDVFRPSDSDLDSVTFEAYLRSRGAKDKALLTATTWTRAMLGINPSDVSALFFLNYCKSGGGLLNMRSDRKGGGQHLRIRTGTQSFAQGLAATLPSELVRLNSPVKEVLQSGSGHVDVVAGDGASYQASKVITTVPSPVLKTINFVPPLHPVKQAWADASGYGYYTKCMAVFKSPFWVQKGFCGLAQSFIGPAAVVRDTSSPADDKHVLTCFMAGPPGQEWAKLAPEARDKALLAQIGKLYQSEDIVQQEFVETVMYEWVNDEWAGYGCPCTSITPGTLDTFGPDALRLPLGNLHFAGTETAGEWKGYMEGAVRSGERAADEVVEDLKSSFAARL
ncbi:hypothetical protein PFICI_10776 [Pestalotiopsis fici W106-1]|uniref:Amine oxidase n=1 Tax=Pestalotiopsis fici (strain W106-1 / CGMCC3.15140) TaxID=1229662 RepID=W3WUU4_PESFW|nr:uncharacterized protein PFICI_10776 [Pestalotiopsis fici W106-1]ETS76902.1 hypothetical protein PFICI_10776 [Pestalotiopsis fici W106-1]